MKKKISQLVSISIATKDRGEVLDQTLRAIDRHGLANCPLIVCDDGSSPPLAPKALELFSDTTLLRHEISTGQAIARNEIAAVCKTPFLLQLDDDSYPVEGSVERLLEQVDARDDWLAVAVSLEEPTTLCAGDRECGTTGRSQRLRGVFDIDRGRAVSPARRVC